MNDPSNISRTELIHRATGITMHNMRMHHTIAERRLEKICPGVHHSQHRLLMLLSKAGKTSSQRDIAGMMRVSPACVARSLKALSQAGMICRGEGADDGRCNEVCLSEKGEQLAHDSCRLFQELDLEMYRDFSESEIRQLISLSERLNRNLAAMESVSESDV